MLNNKSILVTGGTGSFGRAFAATALSRYPGLRRLVVTSSDSHLTVDLGDYFAILPSGASYSVDSHCRATGARPVRPGFRCDSGNNPDFLSVPQLRRLIAPYLHTA